MMWETQEASLSSLCRPDDQLLLIIADYYWDMSPKIRFKLYSLSIQTELKQHVSVSDVYTHKVYVLNIQY